MKHLLIPIIALVFFGCSDPCDPLGNWQITYTWGSGDCGLTGSDVNTITVVEGPDNYLLSSESDEVVGTVSDSDGTCVISAVETTADIFGDGTTSASISYNLRLAPDGSIEGSGSATLSGGIDCSQSFSAVGTLR